jgi:ATP-dependent DNA helicase DinG
MTNVNLLPPPGAFGLPPKFAEWRQLQEQAILAGIDSPRRFVYQAAPTGFGKSPVYVGQALISSARTIILTSTKGLQSQLITDFAPSGLIDIRGMNNYSCIAGDDFGVGHTTMCHEGPCHAGLKCHHKDGGCLYYDATRRAKSASLVVTNYTYWMTINRNGEGLGKFDLMILDEGHNAPDELSDFLAIEVTGQEVEAMLQTKFLGDGATTDDWRQWASYHYARAQGRYDQLSARLRDSNEDGHATRRTVVHEARAWKDLAQRLSRLATLQGEWINEPAGQAGRGMRWDPVWPAPYAERHLFCGIPKVVIFSATVRPKTAAILGTSDYEFLEYPSTFPTARRPFYWVRTIRLNHRTTPQEMKLWHVRIDQIIGQRLDRKGIIHTVSYKRRNEVMQNSEYRDIMVAHDPSNTRSTIERFKRMPAPAVLVSPSVSTGFDFPYEECEYQIITKVPFPDTRSAVMKARQSSDKDYANYLAMQSMVQAYGRGNRAEDDQCECFMIDDNFGWYMQNNGHFAPGWFRDAIQHTRTLPPVLPKMKER